MSTFRVASVFSNHMVLQRDRQFCIFGEGEDGQWIHGHVEGMEERSCIVQDGRFYLYLPPVAAGGPYHLTISCASETIEFEDVLFGDVYLAGGQSNMEFELGNCMEGPQVLAQDSFPNVRFYYTQKKSILNDEFYASEKETAWQLAGSEWMTAWSAVGYFFAAKIAQEKKIPVGIIGCNWGGTSASAWMDRESLLKDEDLRSYVDEYDKAVEGLSVEEQIKAYDDYEIAHAKWEKESAKLYEKDPQISWNAVQEILGPCLWPGPMNCKNPYRPAGLYECMVMRVAPYTLKGVLWYQGESDDHKPRMYEKLFTQMIRAWRGYFRDLSLPFMFVQLPMNRYFADPDYKHWPLVREAQDAVYRTVRNTGMAVISDYSQPNDIHPKYKKPVGERLALQALYHIYHDDIAAFEGPSYDHIDVRADGTICVYLTGAEGGLEIRRHASNADESLGFEIAGEDLVYHMADVKLQADSSILLSSQEVKKPLYVRFLWTNYREPELFGKCSGIPVPTFRSNPSDDMGEQTQSAQIQQIMEV